MGNSKKNILDTKQLIKRWGLKNRRNLDWWVYSGQLKAKRVGRYRYYKLTDVKKFEKSRHF